MPEDVYLYAVLLHWDKYINIFFNSKQHRNWLEFNSGNYIIFHHININKLSFWHNDRSEKLHIKQYYDSIIMTELVVQ